MGVSLKGRDLLCTQDWSVDELEAVLDLAVEMEDKACESMWLGMMGEAFLGLGNHDAAREWLEKALKQTLEIPSLEVERRIRLALGKLNVATGRKNDGIPHLERALAITQQLGMEQAFVEEVEESLLLAKE